MSVPSPSRCEHCGSNRYFADNFERFRDRVSRLESEITLQAGRHAIEIATLKLQLLTQSADRAWAQSKVQSQRRHLNRLEKKLTELGQKPYERDAG